MTIGAGANKFLLYSVQRQANGENTISTFTIGGQAASYTGHRYYDSGTQDFTTDLLIWNQAAISAMLGTGISYTDNNPPANHASSYATFQDCDQSAPTFTGADQASGTTLGISVTATTNDYTVSAHADQAANRAPLGFGVLSQQVVNSASGSAFGIGGGAVSDSTITLTNDGLASQMSGMCVVIKGISVSVGDGRQNMIGGMTANLLGGMSG